MRAGLVGHWVPAFAFQEAVLLKRNPSVPRLLLIFILIAIVVGAAQPACGSVFRSATLSWKILDPAHPNVVTFRLEAAFLASYPSFTWTEGSEQHYGAYPPVGAMLQLTNLLQFLPENAYISLPLPPATVFSRDYPAGEFIYVESVFTYTYPATTGTYFPKIYGNARLRDLLNDNRDISYLLLARIAIDMSAPHDSPVVAMPEIISVPRSQVTSFLMGAYAPQGGELTYSIPPVSETGMKAAVPYRGTRDNPIPIMSLDPKTGLMTWDTRGDSGSEVALGRYSVQLRVADAWGNYTFRDFVVDVVAESSGTPPRIAINGSEAPPTLSGRSPGSVTFELTGSDDDYSPQRVGFMHLAEYFWGTSPLTYTEEWAPPSWGVFTLPYWIIDSTNMVATMPVTINVTAAPKMTCPFSPFSGNWSSVLEATSAAGATMDYSSVITDPDSASVTVRWLQSDCDEALKNYSTAPEVVHSITLESGTGSEPFPQVFRLGGHWVKAYLSDEVGEGLRTGAYADNATCAFSVYVRDTKPPVLPALANVTVEATSASGAAVTFPDATDAVDGSVPLVCRPYESQGATLPSGSTFPFGSTRLVCTATDHSGNSASATFTVTVRDTTPPTIPANVTAVEATGLLTPVTFPDATDAVDGSVPLTCYSSYPNVVASGTAFPVGPWRFLCTAVDHAGNPAWQYMTIDVRDTTPPVIPALANVTVEATSSSGAVVPYVVAKATDIVDGAVALVCTPVSGSTFALGTNAVQCTATDRSGNRATASFTVTVRLASTTTTVTVSPNPAVAGTPVTLTATVTTSGSNTPTGTLILKDGSTTLGTGMLDAAGRLTYTTASLSSGIHSLTAVFGGDVTNAGSTSQAVSETIQDFALPMTPSPVTVTAGQSGVQTISVTPENGFTGDVTFLCSVPASMREASCSATTAHITGPSPAASTLTILTTGPHQVASIRRGISGLAASLGMLFGGFLCIGIPVMRRRRRVLWVSILSLSIFLALGTMSCGGGGTGKGGGTGHTDIGTPAGTYSLTVVAAGGTATHSMNISVTVR